MMWLIVIILIWTSPAEATRYWVATTGNDANSCGAISGDTDPGVYKLTPNSADNCATTPGDIVTFKAGVYAGVNAHIRPSASGTAANPIIFEGDPGDAEGCALASACSVEFRPTTNNSYVGQAYITVRRIWFNNINLRRAYPLHVGGGTSVVSCIGARIEDVELSSEAIPSDGASGMMVNPLCSGGTLLRVNAHDNGDTSGSFLDHGIYLQGDDWIVQNSWLHDNAGFGIQCYVSGSSSDSRADRCKMYNNVVENNPAGVALDGNDDEFIGNIVRDNGGSGVLLGYNGALRAKIFNNTIYNNGLRGIRFGVSGGSSEGSQVRNNIIVGNNGVAVDVLTGAGTITQSHNACAAAESCGTTGKLTVSALTNVVTSAANPVLIAASPAIDAGVNVAASFCGTTPDIGAFEAPVIVGATINGNLLDVTVCTKSPPIQPLGTWTPACTGTGCGTPVNSSVSLLGGSGGIVRINVGGITGGACAAGQTWTVSASGSTNSDSDYKAYEGPQPLHTTTNFAVDSSACDGTGGGGPPAAEQAHYLLDGNTNDSSGNANHATSSSISYVSGLAGQGALTVDGADSYIDTGLLSGHNPSTTHLVVATWVYIDPTELSKTKDIWGVPTGTDQRFLFYRHSSNVWRMSIQNTSGTATEFPVSSGWTHGCIKADSGTDTATLYINGVAGAISGASVIPYTSYTFAGDLRFGLPSGFVATLSGAQILDEAYVYTTDVSCTDLYNAGQPPTSSSTAVQATHQWQGVFTLNDVAENRGSADAQRTIVKSGAGALMVQLNNTSGASVVLQPRFRYNINGGEFSNVVPDSPTADGISYWGTSVPTGLNNGLADGPISGALGHTDSITLTTSSAIPTLEMANNTSYTLRGIFRVDAAIGDVVCFKVYDQGGSALASYTPSDGACLTVVATQATGGY